MLRRETTKPCSPRPPYSLVLGARSQTFLLDTMMNVGRTASRVGRVVVAQASKNATLSTRAAMPATRLVVANLPMKQLPITHVRLACLELCATPGLVFFLVHGLLLSPGRDPTFVLMTIADLGALVHPSTFDHARFLRCCVQIVDERCRWPGCCRETVTGSISDRLFFAVMRAAVGWTRMYAYCAAHLCYYQTNACRYGM